MKLRFLAVLEDVGCSVSLPVFFGVRGTSLCMAAGGYRRRTLCCWPVPGSLGSWKTVHRYQPNLHQYREGKSL